MDLVTQKSLVTVDNEDQLIHVSPDSALLVSEANSDTVVVESSSIEVLEKTATVFVESTELLIPVENAGIEDAPYDSESYARKNGKWVSLGNIITADDLDAAIPDKLQELLEFKDTALGESLANEARYITVHDLIEMGVIRRTGSGFEYLVPNTDIVYTGPRNLAVPPIPKNLKVVGGFGHIQLFWEPARLDYTNHYVTQIWRGTSTLRAAASLLATVHLSYHFVDTTAALDNTYYYWIRFTNDLGIHGPFTTSEAYGKAKLIPEHIKNALIGQIDQSLLKEELLTPITSITEVALNQQLLRQDLIANTAKLTNDLLTEAEYRAAALLMEAEHRGTAISEISQSIETAEENMAKKLEILTSIYGDKFESSKLWQFDVDAEGWSNLTVTNGEANPAYSSTVQPESPALLIEGSDFYLVRARITKVGNPTWKGDLHYKTTFFNSAFNNARMKTINVPVFFAGSAIAEWDMEGEDDWDISTITGIKITLSENPTEENHYLIDWISIGKPSKNDSIAAVAEEITVLTEANEATAEKVTDLATQVRGDYTGNDVNSVTSGLIHQTIGIVTEKTKIVGKASEVIEVGVKDLSKNNGNLDSAINGWERLATSVEDKKVQVIRDDQINQYFSAIGEGLANQNQVLNNLGLTVQNQIVSTAYEIDELRARAGENEGRIQQVENIAVGNNIAVLNQINTLSGQVTNNHSTAIGLIAEEQNLRITANEVLANQINTVSGEVVSAEARSAGLINEEKQLRINAVGAVANSVNTLRTDFEFEKGQVDLRIAAGIADAGLVSSTDLGAVAERLSTTEATIYGPPGDPAAGLSAKVEDATEALAQVDGKIAASRTIKLNVNSAGKLYVASMGLTLQGEGDHIQSEIAFIADTFRLMSTADGGLVQPFYVNGTNVYIDNAFIKNGTLDFAKISYASIADASIGFAKIANDIQSNSYTAGSVGWKINKNGTAEFNNVKVRGDIEASSLKANTVMVDTLHVGGNAITVTQFSSSGFVNIVAGNSVSGQCPMQITMPNGSSGIIFIAVITAVGTSNLEDSILTAYITKNGSTLHGISFTVPHGKTTSFTVNAVDTNASGTNNYSLLLAASNKGIDIWSSSMNAMAGKR